MKRIHIRAACAVLSLITAFSAAVVPASALYRGVLGDVYYAHSRQIGAGVDFTEYRSVTDGLSEHAYLFEYRPDEGSLPLVSYGDKLIGSSRVTSLADFESENGYNVLGGVNGDFYSMYTGIPMGAVIRDGRIISDDDKNSAVGFTYNGETIFGDPGITFTVTHTYEKTTEDEVSEVIGETDTQVIDETVENSEITENSETVDETQIKETETEAEEATEDTTDESEEADISVDETDTSNDDTIISKAEEDTEAELIAEILPVSYFNKYPTEWGAYLVDEIYADSTKSTKDSLEIVITLDDPESYARVGGTLVGTVSAVHHSTTDTEILPGTVVISVCETSTYRKNYENVTVGNRIEISFEANEGWENVQTAIGGSDVFIKDGVIDEAVIDEAHEKTANPRTAVGVRADGTVLFFAVDGRSNESFGLRMISLAKTLEAFGCVYAMNLDGGGSTTAVVKFPGSDSAVLVNNASDSAERAVSNALLLVNTFSSDNIPKYIVPNDTEPVILPGESYTFDGDFYDIAMTKVDFGLFENESGEDYIPLSADDVKLEFDMSRLSYYTDETMPNLGTISDDGKSYTADGITGEIPLLFTAVYGDETLTGRVILFVAPAPDNVYADLGPTVYTQGEVVEIGYEAYYMDKPVPARPEELSFILKDNEIRSTDAVISDVPEENRLAECSIGYIDTNGSFVPFENADGSAWLTISLDPFVIAEALIVVGSGSVTAFDYSEISYDFSAIEAIDDTEEASDTEFTESEETAHEISETETIKNTETTEAVTEESSDIESVAEDTENSTLYTESFAFESSLPLYNALSLELYANDYSLDFYAKVRDFDGNVLTLPYERQLNVPFEEDGSQIYRIALDKKYTELVEIIGVDSEENAGLKGNFFARAEINFDDAEIIFSDTKGHWARKNINTLYRNGIVGGEEWDFHLVYRPERSLTRAEFATMICRVLELDSENAVCPVVFDDLEEIPVWALGYINAVSEIGIMNGKSMPDGTLCFDASGYITRQEIMQVIGNIIKLEEAKSVINADDEAAENTETDSEIKNSAVSTDEYVAEEAVPEEITEESTEEIIILDDTADDREAIDEVADFADAWEIAPWAYDNVLITVRYKIITGYSDNTIKPTRNVTRAEAATVILRAKNYIDTLDTMTEE